MQAKMAQLARKSLDQRLADVPVDRLAVPPRGWIRAIREALGMSHHALGARMGTSASTAAALERSETAGRIQLDSLRRVAAAMDCDLVYALVPRLGLEATVRQAAIAQLSPHLRAVAQTMALEDQSAGVAHGMNDEAVSAELDAIIKSRNVWR